MTSNIGSQRILGMQGENVDERMRKTVMEDLRGHFRPEFLNRVDEIIVFHGLSEDDLTQIVEIQLGRLRKRLEERKITLELTRAAKVHLVNVGYEPDFGARPLKRAIQKEIENVLARRLLEGSVRDGQNITCDFDKARGHLTFTDK